MVNNSEPKNRLLAWIHENPNKQLTGDDRKIFYNLYREFIKPYASTKQCNSFVRNVLVNNRPVLHPEYTHRELIARDKGTDRSDDFYNSNVKHNPHNNPRNNAKKSECIGKLA